MNRALPAVTGRFLREIGLVAVGLLIYFLIRGNVTERGTLAVHNAASVINAEKALGIFWEPAMQRWVLESTSKARW